MADGMMHPLDPLSETEIRASADAVKAWRDVEYSGEDIRFNVITLQEPSKSELLSFGSSKVVPERLASAVILFEKTAKTVQLILRISSADSTAEVASVLDLKEGTQPPFTPDDCDLAEEIVKKDEQFISLMKERYGVEDMSLVACDPWSVHVTSEEVERLSAVVDNWKLLRLVQTFIYLRDDVDDNHYAHPVDILPMVDLNSKRVVLIDGVDREPPEIPKQSVNYHRNKVSSNDYLETSFREEKLAPLNITQPEGPSFDVDGNLISWQKWQFRIGTNSREGLVLYDVYYGSRKVMSRGSLVEMAVPYGDTHRPFHRKCAFDVGDYGLGFCANTLELGCDCLGYIKYFDAVFNDSEGNPVTKRKMVCMHEEDAGLLWKHVEYRNGHSEARRKRQLVLSFIATVVNYEYLFYWYFAQDGSIEFEIKLSGELSTNLLSSGEKEPDYGVIVAPGVNAQVHQHMFCMRLDMSVDGDENVVSEVDFEALPVGPENPFGNAFRPRITQLTKESEAQRDYVLGRSWKISSKSLNSVNGKNTAYKLIPFTRGPSHPPLLTQKESAVSARGQFATKALWVTKYNPSQNFPAGMFPTQKYGETEDKTNNGSLSDWVTADRNLDGEDVVIWHSFGLAHVPRIEDFPVMPCEMTGFSLKPDGFFSGNPAIDLAPSPDKSSHCMTNGHHQRT